MAGENCATDKRRVPFDKTPGDEDRDLEIVLLEKIEELGGAVGGGVAVEGDCDPGARILDQLEHRRRHDRSWHGGA
jgi:hypothetical protein